MNQQEKPEQVKTARGNYIHFKYMHTKKGELVIEIKDRNKKFWYYKLKSSGFRIINVTSSSVFDQTPEDLEND